MFLSAVIRFSSFFADTYFREFATSMCAQPTTSRFEHLLWYCE